MPLLEQKKSRTSILWAIAVALSALIVGGLTSGGARFNLHEPLNYSGDSIFYLMTTRRLGDGTGYLLNSRQGFPFGSQLFDFVGSDWGSMFALWGLEKISGSTAWANNVYFLIGFPLNALAAFWCLRKLDISDQTSSTFSFLFAIIPFHFLRIQHLYFTWYFVAPVYCWLSFELYKGAERFSIHWAWRAALLATLASFGVYYAWFGCMVLLVGAALGWIRHRTMKPIYAGVFSIVFVGIGVALNLLPNLHLINQFGKNTEIINRVPSGSEVYGLKITQLLLPRIDHRMESLSEITARYVHEFPNVNENMHSSLGFVGVIGFILILASSIIYSPRVQEQRRSQLFMLGATTLFLLLTATTGGFSALFSLLVTPLIRGWNRISVFIAFLALAGLAVAIEGARHRFASSGQAAKLAAFGLAIIAAFGAWDQTAPADRKEVRNAQAEFRSDQTFFRTIEASLPKGAAVYQLPFMRFPEAVMKGQLSSYDTGKGFLHSQSLKWSYGVAAGRLGSDFMENLSNQPIATQLEVAHFLGFSGFLLDRRGYADSGGALEAGISKLLAGEAPTEDQGKHLAFYSLGSFPAADSPRQLSPGAREFLECWKVSKVAGAVATRPPFDIDFMAPALLGPQVRAVSGLSGPEEWGTWSIAKVVKLQFKKPLPSRFTLELVANAAGPNVGREISVRVGSQVKAFTATAEMSQVNIPFELTESVDLIELTVPAPTSPMDMGVSTDTRSLGVGLQSLSIVE